MWFRTEHRGVHIAFTDRAEGNLAAHTGEDPHDVAANRAGLERDLGLAEGTVRYLHQVHGTTVEVVADGGTPSAPPMDEAPEADAAVSPDGTPLAVLTADCLPVVLVGFTRHGSPVTAVAHAGRRGLLDGVLDATTNTLQHHGALDIHAWIGPSICGQCYEVPARMQREAGDDLTEVASTTSWGTPGLDLPAAAREALVRRGVVVAEDPRRRSQWCTLEHDRLPSYRRNRTTARLAGVVWVQRPGPRDEDPDGAHGTRDENTGQEGPGHHE